MWRVYLFEFCVVVVVSVLWAHLIDKSKDNNEDETD
jgi:hypothetical protein